MKRYAGESGSVAVGSSKTLLTLISAATIKPRLYDITVGSSATPADNQTIFHILRFTAVGTEGTGFTPVALDPDDPAALSDCGQGVFSVEPTYTASSQMLVITMNQRATFRWVAAPGNELVAPATASNGLGFRSISSGGTAAHNVCFNWSE